MSEFAKKLARKPPDLQRSYLKKLPYSQAQAGKSEKFYKTLTKFDFLEAKVSKLRPQPLIDDYDLAFNPDLQISKEQADTLKLIQDALRLSVDALSEDSTQLSGQLLGRLAHFETPEIRVLLTQARQKEAPILYPLTPTLNPPGSPLVRTLTGHTDSVRAVAIADTANGIQVISGSGDSTLKVWDLQTGQELKTLRGHNSGVNAVAITPDSKQIVSASSDNTLKVWDLKTGHELLTLRGHKESVNAVAVTPDGKKIISGSGSTNFLQFVSLDNTLKIWDLQTGQELFTLPGHTAKVTAVAVTSDGTKIVSASEDKTLKIWDLNTHRELFTFNADDEINDVAITPDDQKVISASGSQDDFTLRVWDLQNGEELQREGILNSGLMGELAVAITPDGKWVISGSDDNTLKIFDFRWPEFSSIAFRTLKGHTRDVNAVAVTPDSKWVISASWDNTLKVWDLQNRKKLPILPGHKSSVKVTAISPDGNKAVSVGHSDIKIWDLHKGQELKTLEGCDAVKSVAFTPDSKRLISGNEKNPQVWDLQSGQELFVLSHWDVNAVALTPDGKQVVSASHDGTLKVWDLETGEKLHTLSGHSNWVMAVAITPDSKQAVSASWDKTFKVWDLQTGLELKTLNGQSNRVRAIAITPDSQQLISCGQDGLQVWDLVSGEELWTLSKSTGYKEAVVITPDGKKVISCSDSKTLKVWNLHSGEELLTLSGHTKLIQAWVVTPDGKYLVSVSDDHSLKIWDLQSGDVVASFNGDSALNSCAVAPDGVTILAGEASGRVHFLRFKLNNSEIQDEPDLVIGELQRAEELFNQGKELIYVGEYEEAIKKFDLAIQFNPNFHEAWCQRGKALSRLEKYWDAYNSFDKALGCLSLGHEDYWTIWSDRLWAKYSLAAQIYNFADDKYREGDTPEAIRRLDIAIELNNEYVAAYCFRGYLRTEIGNYQGAVEDYKKAINLQPSDYLDYYWRGRAKDYLEDFQGAIEDYTQAIKLKPELAYQYNPALADAYCKRGILLQNSGEAQSAIEDYTQAIYLNPNLDIAYQNRGNLFIKKREFKEAIKDYTQVLRIDPNNAKAYCYRALGRSILKDYFGSIEDYNQAIYLQSNDAEFYRDRGLSYAAIGDDEKAVEDFDKAKQLFLNQENIAGYQQVIEIMKNLQY